MRLKRVLLVPGVHAPYHDLVAWRVLIKAAKKLKPHVIVVLGDFFDCYAVSAHDRDPSRAACLETEIADARKMLSSLGSLASERRIFCAGNHENRLERYLTKQAPALHGMLKIPEVFRLDGWEYIPYRQSAMVGKLMVTHDVGHAGVNAARQTLGATGCNVAIGHTHHLSVVYGGTTEGERRVSATLGWLGDPKHADYIHQAKRAAWQHGFGVVSVERDGTAHLRAVPIVNGRSVLNGELVRV